MHLVKTFWKVPVWRSVKYTDWIREQLCVFTYAPGPNDPHHEALPGMKGMSTKVGDEYLVPIRHDLHQMMESPGYSRKDVWSFYGKDPETEMIRLRQKYFEETGKRPGVDVI